MIGPVRPARQWEEIDEQECEEKASRRMSQAEEEVAEADKIGNLDLVKSPRLVFACLCGALSYFCDT